MAHSIRLRRWQKAALDSFRARPGDDFLAVATPGAGKTTFALAAARQHLADHPRRRLLVVAPTQHLKGQWADAAEALDLHLEPSWTAADGRLPPDVHGMVTTYQQVAASTAAVARIAADAFVVLDEAHHSGEERAWGDAARAAFAGAAVRLSLSGTPFRSDTRAIPFVRYDDDGLARADVEYGYADAIADGGVVRPVHFPRTDGEMEWVASDGTLASATFQDHARGIAGLLRHRLGVVLVVAVSEDAGASARIAAFARGTEPWIVAVRMLSEGVDIPRLRVGVFATTTTTELFFRQAVGRLVRWTRGLGAQPSHMFIPDDPRLRAHALAIAEQRRHSLRRGDGEAAGEAGDGLEPEPFERPDPGDQLSLFAAISAVPVGGSAGAPPEGGAWRAAPPAAAADEGVLLELAPAPLLVAPAPPGPGGEPPLPPRERRRLLRDANSSLVRLISRITGLSHSQVNAELNRRVGVERVGEATLDQLERRREHASRWLAVA